MITAKLAQAANELRLAGYRVVLHRRRTPTTYDIVSFEIFCPSILMNERMDEVRDIVGADFLVHKNPNEDAIYIVPNAQNNGNS